MLVLKDLDMIDANYARAQERERERERVREEREGGKEVGRMGEGKGKREFICALALRHDVCFPLN
jgi:hypothetical protein